MIIMKFGGTSIKNATAIRNVTSIIRNYLHQKPIIVLSAIAGITDILEEALDTAVKQNTKFVEHYIDRIKSTHLKLVNQLFNRSEYYESLTYTINSEIEKLRILLSAVETIRVQSDNLTHAILSTGEILSSQILYSYLKFLNIDAQYVDARTFIITTDPKSGISPIQQKIQKAVKKQILPHLKANQAIITQGYIAATDEGIPTTLGRNGSDYSASLLAAALEADEIQIWTDVNGILTADPTIIPYARPLDLMTFEEACELAYFGARVLHPASIQPALEKGISVRVLNSHFPDEKGTVIVASTQSMQKSSIRSIAYKEHITLITLQSSNLLFSPEILGEFFHSMTKYGKHVYAVNKSATKLSLTLEKEEKLNDIMHEFNFSGDVKVESNKTIVSVVGQNVRDNPVIVWQVIKMLQEAGVKLDLISQISSQISFMFIIDEVDIEKTVKLIHKEFIEPLWIAKTA